MELTPHEFFRHVAENKKEHPEWRYGQTLFNTLYLLAPEKANEIRGTNVDPFHSNEQKVYDRFYETVFPGWFC